MTTKLTILFFASNPEDVSQLNLDEEIRSITMKIRASEHRDVLDLISRWAIRPDDLLQELNTHKPTIVHFSGHGSKAGELILMNDLRQAKTVSPSALKALFSTLKDNIRLVVLNACYSKTQATAIADVIDCVVGMNASIGDQAAITFAASFYRAIGFGRSVKEAFEQGKVSLMLEGIPEENTPELMIRRSIDPSRVYLVDPRSMLENAEVSQLQGETGQPSKGEGKLPGGSHIRRVAMGGIIGGVSSFVAVFILVFILLIVVSTLSTGTAFQGFYYIVPPLVYGFLGAIAGGVIARLGKRSKSFVRLILIAVIITVPILAALVWMSDRSDRVGIAFSGGVVGIPAVIAIAMLIYVVTVARKWISEGSGNRVSGKPNSNE